MPSNPGSRPLPHNVITLVLGGADPSAKEAEAGWRRFLGEVGIPFYDYPGLTWQGCGIRDWLLTQGVDPCTPLQLLAFSAGVVGAAWLSQVWAGRMVRVIAVDGWCVPLGSVGVYRLSHDWITHANGMLLGGEQFFYADPHVSHWALWQDPDQVWGWHGSQRVRAGDWIREALITTTRV